MIISAFFPIKPIPKGRPRARRCGNFIQMYTPAETKKYEATIKDLAESHFKTAFDGELHARIQFLLPVKNFKTCTHTARPDVDNLAKAVLDALNGIAYHDDSQITSLTITKQYCKLGAEGFLISISDAYDLI